MERRGWGRATCGTSPRYLPSSCPPPLLTTGPWRKLPTQCPPPRGKSGEARSAQCSHPAIAHAPTDSHCFPPGARPSHTLLMRLIRGMRLIRATQAIRRSDSLVLTPLGAAATVRRYRSSCVGSVSPPSQVSPGSGSSAQHPRNPRYRIPILSCGYHACG